ncbi:hypothetical protein HOLleu_23256 [Holothuria leucospilota]|uniref:Sushi domain-containing protein n=1 Tax=Holothuria leucospilota TaxID=206669 RepID=A0A9Q1BUQ4_HOLLE|nr:hypothetical protein HOLleu_23256 [Holothuria leucospilota]
MTTCSLFPVSVVYCELVATPLNGFVDASTKTTMFFCSKGYQLHGEEVINCNNTLKQWDGPTDPLCLKTNCKFVCPFLFLMIRRKYVYSELLNKYRSVLFYSSALLDSFANNLPYVILCVSVSGLLVILLLRE